ncbi:MAG: response regulator transcription factor [Oscillospiraceae bacterium]|jgi:two-component system response regulator VicR|nr:response regulator transcription factor [Oscillospiraceae bacterium]
MGSNGKTVLIVEDEKTIVDILEFNLKLAGYTVIAAFDGITGLEMALNAKPDLVLLDIMLPRLDGFKVCRAIREKDALLPVLLLTAREEEEDKVLGLEIGADDYITKPFSIKELLARVKANIRRTMYDAQTAEDSADTLTAGKLTLNQNRMEVRRAGETLELSQREYDILCYLWKSGKVTSREELMEKVWGYDYYGDLRVVDVAVRRLREKLEENPAEPRYILTRRGAGYYFDNEQLTIDN